MSPYLHTALVLLCIYIPYRFGIYVGGIAGYNAGFDRGAHSATNALIDSLRENFDLDVTHSLTIKDKKNGEDI